MTHLGFGTFCDLYLVSRIDTNQQFVVIHNVFFVLNMKQLVCEFPESPEVMLTIFMTNFVVPNIIVCLYALFSCMDKSLTL